MQCEPTFHPSASIANFPDEFDPLVDDVRDGAKLECTKEIMDLTYSPPPATSCMLPVGVGDLDSRMGDLIDLTKSNPHSPQVRRVRE